MKASRGGTFNVDLADVIKSPEVKIEKKKYVVLSNASSSSGKRDRDIVLINCSFCSFLFASTRSQEAHQFCSGGCQLGFEHTHRSYAGNRDYDKNLKASLSTSARSQMQQMDKDGI